MAAKNESHGTRANLSKDSPAHRVRDGRKTAHNDSSTESDNNPPNHGRATNSDRVRFLRWVGETRDRLDGFDPDLSELGDLYRQWSDGHTEQADLAGWSE